MVSAFVDMEDAVPYFSSSAASQKAKFSPEGTHTDIYVMSVCQSNSFIVIVSTANNEIRCLQDKNQEHGAHLKISLIRTCTKNVINRIE